MAGVDLPNQFPNSFMAKAVRQGQSQMRSVDTQTRVTGEQNNVSAASVVTLTVPASSLANNWTTTTYAVITAVGGTLYITYDGTTPSASNYAVALAAGASMPVQGTTLAAVKAIGTTMSVAYWG